MKTEAKWSGGFGRCARPKKKGERRLRQPFELRPSTDHEHLDLSPAPCSAPAAAALLLLLFAHNGAVGQSGPHRAAHSEAPQDRAFPSEGAPTGARISRSSSRASVFEWKLNRGRSHLREEGIRNAVEESSAAACGRLPAQDDQRQAQPHRLSVVSEISPIQVVLMRHVWMKRSSIKSMLTFCPLVTEEIIPLHKENSNSKTWRYFAKIMR
ncbi:hypothetical protein J437_LFUL017666 [Ladona fulva]|uniref:Uncharacterized protein n=1 Tax=Ladona fulva TaxID=123851 RepID=A0A8K0KQL0_LADFU|nr:hypothetical protein J437_LFUL017666 [Ladona fulva]